MTTPYDQRKQAAHERLRTAFDPQTDIERRHVLWLLSSLTPAETDLWSTMVERAYLRGIDIGERAAAKS